MSWTPGTDTQGACPQSMRVAGIAPASALAPRGVGQLLQPPRRRRCLLPAPVDGLLETIADAYDIENTGTCHYEQIIEFLEMH